MNNILIALTWREINSSHRLMMAIVLTFGILHFIFGEIVPAGGGLGWDGIDYADMTRNLGSIISQGTLSNYYAHKILPSLIVRGMLLVSGASFSDANIIRGFECYNLILLIGANLTWRRIANVLSISLGGRWLGFCGLFLNYLAAKQIFYVPVTTDTTALLVGLLALLFYIERRPIALFAVTIVGAFGWQIVHLCGALLLIFPRTELPSEVIFPKKLNYTINAVWLRRFLKYGWGILLILSIAGVICCFRAEAFLDITKIENSIAKKGILHIIDTLATRLGCLLTSLPSVTAAAIALALLAGSVLFFRKIIVNLTKTPLILVALAIAALVIPLSVIHLISNPSLQNKASAGDIIVSWCLQPPIGKFLLPIVDLVGFFGPVVLLLLLNWRAFCEEARKLGPGFMAVVGSHVLLGLAVEARYVIFAWPFFVLGAVLVMEGRSGSPTFNYVFAALTILYAQFWLKMNLAPWLGGDTEHLSEFPKQLYFMHYGMWMNWWAYSIQFCLMLVSIVWLRSTLLQVRKYG